MDFDGSILVFIFNAASAPFGFSEPDMHTYTQQMAMDLNESVLLVAHLFRLGGNSMYMKMYIIVQVVPWKKI